MFSGNARWTAPGIPLVAMRNAFLNRCGILAPSLMRWFHLVMGRISASWSMSVNECCSTLASPMSDDRHNIGMLEFWASLTAGTTYRAPPPLGVSTTPTLPDTRAYPSAMYPALRSSRQRMWWMRS